MNATLKPGLILERRLEDRWHTKAANRISRPERVEFVGWPRDLRNWVTASTLLVWIEEELNHVDWQNPAILDHLRGYPEYRPKPMLRLLSFAYAVGMLNSGEISQACHSDPLLLVLCDGPVPFTEELVSFRRKNGGILECILHKLLIRSVKEKIELLASEMTSRLVDAARDCAAVRIQMSRQLDGEELEP